MVRVSPIGDRGGASIPARAWEKTAIPVLEVNARAEREIGWEEEVLEGGDSCRSGINGDCGAPERSPAIQMDEAGEPDGVVLWCGEGDKAAARRRRRLL